jgi:hypothetical protein
MTRATNTIFFFVSFVWKLKKIKTWKVCQLNPVSPKYRNRCHVSTVMRSLYCCATYVAANNMKHNWIVCSCKVKKVKGTGSPCNMPGRSRGAVEVQPYSFFDLGAGQWWVVNNMPRALYLRQRPGTYCTGGWVGPTAGLDASRKTSPHRGTLRVKCPIFLSDSNKIWIFFPTDFRRSPQYQISRKYIQ